jgi:thioredoxin-dependent peroxiredoxin
MTRLAEGDKAPTFTLPDQDGKKVSLASLIKQAKEIGGTDGTVVVYFYPADDTPGCTKEACQFNDNLSAFNESGTVIVGISKDSAEKHQRFREKYGLEFPLLTDAERTTMAEYGAYGEKMMYGKKTVGVIRSTFVIGANGKIRRAWYSVKADGHAAKVLETVQ